MKKSWLAVLVLFYPGAASAIEQTIPAGQTVSNGTVNSIVTQNVYGTTNNFSILGTQNIMNGGVANGSDLYSYSGQNVAAGGKAYNTNIQHYATQSVRGESYGSIVNSYGTMTVSNGGIADGTQVNGGTMSVLAGGESRYSVIDSGTVWISGKDMSSVLKGGRQIVNAGAEVSGINIYGGRQEVEGEVLGSTLFSGKQVIMDGAVLSGATIKNGGLEVFSGAELKNLILEGGTAEIENGVTVSGITRLNGGLFSSYGDNVIPDLQMNGGTVKMAGGFNRLEINNLEGQGNFYLKSEVDISRGDELVVQTGGGRFGVALIDYSAGEDFPADIHLIQSEAQNAEFYLLGGAVDVGAFRYDLHHVGDEWLLKKTSIASDTSVVAKNTFIAVSSIFYSHLNSLNNRFGDLRFNRKSGLWVHGLGRNMRLDFDDSTKSRVNLEGVQAGFDKQVVQDVVHDWRIGIFAGYTHARQKFDRSGRGDADTKSLGLYTTVSGAGGWYGDFSSTYYRHDQKVKSYLPTGEEVAGSYDLNGWSVSAQTGKRWKFNEFWFIEPQLQLSYIQLQNIDYRTNYNTRVRGHYSGAGIARAGLMLGCRFDEALGFPLETFVSLSVLNEFDSRGRVTVAGYDFEEDLSGTFYELGAGVQAEVSDKFNLFAEVNTLWNGRVKVPFDINFGLKYEF